ncbi:hypothetical protein TTHERM_00052590 (macronuclear) [Tetrahymena thermophila SB210]|uniref:EF-hand domain-containing protein n=1 Tax=Tetrahymena thermophila (strain SB210) TaxID=312017 RepID=Q23CT1_TETTS|nr:hypothetical protein TTHERM_00052590 [Tetrahymena thermophila SB210]EAR94644.1 hypothetical protein TTHERM_00052590 [Tetrahymena thermophila SB210]|eukprot:XP_001014955.1 hypothetical protein TTHERM_00052590 [Tetrahymena thermophila SB210]
MIQQTKGESNSPISQVEKEIDKHREKMKELEYLYYKKKLTSEASSNIIRSQPLYLEDETLVSLADGKELINLKKQNNTLGDKKNQITSLKADIYDYESYSNKRVKKNLNQQRDNIDNEDAFEIAIPKKSKQKENYEQYTKMNQHKDQSPSVGIGFLSDTTQSINFLKYDQQKDTPKEKQFHYKQEQQKMQAPKIPIKQEKQIESPIKQYGQKDMSNSIEIKKQQTLMNERNRKLQILREEMQQIDKLMQEKGVERKKVYIEPSDKAIENATHIPIEKKIYQHKYEEFLVDKKVKQQADNYFQKLQRPEFERMKSAKSFDKYKKLHPESDQEFGITDRPIEIKKTYEEIIKDEDEAKIQQYSQQIEQGKRSTEEKRMKNLYTRIISDSKQSIQKRKQKDDDFILKFLFMQIDTQKSGLVSSQEIFDSLKENKDAIVYFDLCVKTLYSDLDKFKTQRKGLFNIEEFSAFVNQQNQMSKKTLQTEKEALKSQIMQEENLLHKIDKLKDKNELFLLYEKDPKNTYGTCVLNEAKLDVLREVFSELDTFNDFIVKRLDLVKELLNNNKIQKILTYPAVKIPIVNRKVSLQNILEQVEKEYTLADEQQQKPREYISWNQFFEYFKNYQKPSFILDHEISSSQEAKIFDISEDYLLLIQDVFDMIPRVSTTLDYVSTTDFVIAAKKDPQIRSIESEVVRTKSEETGLPQEILSEVLDRIIAEGGEYIQWHEVKLFFSKRGRPIGEEFGNQDENQNVDQGQKSQVQIEEMKSGVQFKIEKSSPQKQSSPIKKSNGFNDDNDDDDNQYYDEQTINSKKYDMYQQHVPVRKPTVQEEIANLRLQGQYDSGEEMSDDYMKEIQQNSDEDDFEGEQYNQLKQLDYMMKGDAPQKNKLTAEEAIQEHYTKKRVVQAQKQDTELKEEINDFDKYYKELLQRQKEAQLGPLESLKQKEQLEDPVKYGILKHTAVDYDKYFGKMIKNKALNEQEKVDITVPKPFSFEKRETSKQKSIYQQKKEQYLNEVLNRDEEEMKKRFKANPIPTTTKIPMFNNIIEKNKEKREKIRQESVKITLETQNPFSFYEKDIQKREEKKQKIVETVNTEVSGFKQKAFKAKEVPASSKVDMLKQMEQEREENRKKRVEERKQEQIKSVQEFTRLAGASEKWKETLKKRETAKTSEEEKCTFAPKINKEIPDTSKKSETQISAPATQAKLKAVSAFTGLLKDKIPPTEQKPFNFQPPVPKQASREYMDSYNESIKADKLEHKNLLSRLVPLSKKKLSEKAVKEPEEQEENTEQQLDELDNLQQQQEEAEQQKKNEDQAEDQVFDMPKKTKSKIEGSANKIQSQTSNANLDNDGKPKGTTKAEQLLIKKREDERKKKEEEENQRKKEKEERDKKLKERASEVKDKFGDPRSAKQAQEEMEKQKLKERQEVARQQKQEYEQQIKDMESRVKNRQLLTEAKSHGSSALDKYRKMKPPVQDQENNQQQENSQKQIQEQLKQDNKQSANNIDKSNNSAAQVQKQQDHAEENYDEDFGDENDQPVRKDDFDDLSD